MHTHTHTHTHTDTHKHTHTHTDTHKHIDTHKHTHTHTDTDPNTQILTISAGAMGRWAPMAVKLKGQMAAQKPYNKSHRE